MPSKIYSYSRLSTFEQCKLKFKFRYIDKIIPEVEQNIEAHLGKCVHSALEWLYSHVKEGKVPSLDELILAYVEIWEQDYKPTFQIINKFLTAKDYFNKGILFLVNYYEEHKPFDDNTLEIEKEIIIDLEPSGEYKIRGFIDRIAYNLETQEYEVHDYKTANTLPSKEKIETDRQLALYSIAIKNEFGQEKEVRLIWHYLAYNKRIHVKKNNQELEQLKKETIELIKKIESATEFPPNKSILCDWCEYKSICPVWKNSSPDK
jgi:RecB family exonuclease